MESAYNTDFKVALVLVSTSSSKYTLDSNEWSLRYTKCWMVWLYNVYQGMRKMIRMETMESSLIFHFKMCIFCNNCLGLRAILEGHTWETHLSNWMFDIKKISFWIWIRITLTFSTAMPFKLINCKMKWIHQSFEWNRLLMLIDVYSY